MVKDKFKLTTPILFLVFNRLKTTGQVFQEIQKAKPRELFVAADGPRDNEEKKKTDAVRKYILKNMDWECKVKTLFREKNLGCKYAVSSAIDWFFENVESGIILEDDCLPSQSFFRFCQELLEKYKDDERIMQIGGTNVEVETKIPVSYFFTNGFNAWGWATWRRAWEHYDVEMKKWGKFRTWRIFFLMANPPLFIRLKSWRLFNLTYKKKIDTWDYQWIFCCMMKKALCVIPKVNLVTNLGFEENATHTFNYEKNKKKLPMSEIEFPLIVNNSVVPRKEYMKNCIRFFK